MKHEAKENKICPVCGNIVKTSKGIGSFNYSAVENKFYHFDCFFKDNENKNNTIKEKGLKKEYYER